MSVFESDAGKTCLFLPVGSGLEIVFSRPSLTSNVSMMFSPRSSEAVIPLLILSEVYLHTLDFYAPMAA